MSKDQYDILNAKLQDILVKLGNMEKLILANSDQNSLLSELLIEAVVTKNEITVDDIVAISNNNKTKPRSTAAVSNINIDVYQKKMYLYLKENGSLSDAYVEHFTKTCIDSVLDKLTSNSANNVKYCFVWCYSHVDEIRSEVLNLPNVESLVIKNYDDSDKRTKTSTLTDVLKCEGNCIFKHFKDETFFNAYCVSLKRRYNAVVTTTPPRRP